MQNKNQCMNADSKYKFDIKNKKFNYLHFKILFKVSPRSQTRLDKKTKKNYVNIPPTSVNL